MTQKRIATPPTIDLGIVGLGHIATWQLLALAESNRLFRLVAAADLDRTKASQVPHVEFYDSYKKLVASPRVHAVLVSTSLPTHFEVVAAALQGGKHVLVEKPATQNIEQFDELSRLARSRGVRLVVAFHAAFALDLLWFLEDYKWREIHGEIQGIRCEFSDPFLCESDPLARISSLEGSWTDGGVNELSVVARLIDLRGIRIDETRFRHVVPYPGDVQASVSFSFPSDEGDDAGRGRLVTNWDLGKNQKRTYITFSDAKTRILLDHSLQAVRLIRPDVPDETLTQFSGERLVNHYLGVFRHFHSCLAEGRDNLEEARSIHEILFSAASRMRSP